MVGMLRAMIAALKQLRDGEDSVAATREKIDQILDQARQRYASGSDDWAQLETIADNSKAYINSIELHVNESRFQFDSALNAIELKVHKVQQLALRLR